MSIRLIVTFFCLSAAIAGCTTTRLDKYEKLLGTSGALNFEFHRVVDDPTGLGLRFPGFLVGVEKGWPGDVGCAPVQDGTIAGHLDFRALTGGHPNTVMRHVVSRVDESKCLFLSHWLEYSACFSNDDALLGIQHKFHHTLYESRKGESPDQLRLRLRESYDESWNQIGHFRQVLTQRLRDYGATHVILYVMGWSSGQVEALRNTNSLHLAIINAAGGENVTNFRPLPVLVTWPSHWGGNIPVVGPLVEVVSYKNKADDADELGAVFLNALIHQAIIPAVAEIRDADGRSVGTVAISHSFGARAVSRALFSENALYGYSGAARWNLFVGLEPAFSIDRFVGKGDMEGTPYTDIAAHVGKIVLTWARNDSANPIAFWSSHAGGRRGISRAEQSVAEHRSMNRQSLFEFLRLSPSGHLYPQPSYDDQTIAYVDGSSVIRYDNYAKSGGAHSDIYNKVVGKMLNELIQRVGHD